MGSRPQKVQEALRREISLILQNQIKDPRLGFITITRVEISGDLKNADVYYSVLGNQKEINNTRHALISAAGYIKKLIGERLKMRYMPEISFKIDKSMEHSQRIFEILDKIKKESSPDAKGKNNQGDKKV